MGYKIVMNYKRGGFTLQKFVCRQNEPIFHLLLSQKRVNGEILRLNAWKEHCIFIILQNQNTFLDLYFKIFSFVYCKLILNCRVLICVCDFRLETNRSFVLFSKC